MPQAGNGLAIRGDRRANKGVVERIEGADRLAGFGVPGLHFVLGLVVRVAQAADRKDFAVSGKAGAANVSPKCGDVPQPVQQLAARDIPDANARAFLHQQPAVGRKRHEIAAAELAFELVQEFTGGQIDDANPFFLIAPADREKFAIS